MKPQRGLTLIEILLALIVMVVGVIGILAIFPATLEAAKVATEETQATIIGETVANSLAAAARYAEPLPGGPYRLTLVGDSINSLDGALVFHQLDLPLIGQGWRHHPAASPGGSVPSGTPEIDPDWRLTGDPWTRAQFDAIKNGTDASEPLDQFAYSIDVRKINTLEHLMLPPPAGQGLTLAQVEPLVRTWEVRIHVFRTQVLGASFGTGSQSAVGGVTAKKWIATLTTRVGVR